MKKLLPLVAILLASVSTYAQVGINTTEPSTTLDVNGNIRVRGMKLNSQEVQATHVLGIDDAGNFVEIEVGENIILEDNTLKVKDERYRYRSSDPINVNIIHNMSLVILPGEPNDGNRIMKIITTGGSLDITGIEAGEEGESVWLMAFTDKIKLRPNDSGSDPENRFQFNNSITINQYEMIQLVYDASIQKWLVMDN